MRRALGGLAVQAAVLRTGGRYTSPDGEIFRSMKENHPAGCGEYVPFSSPSPPSNPPWCLHTVHRARGDAEVLSASIVGPASFAHSQITEGSIVFLLIPVHTESLEYRTRLPLQYPTAVPSGPRPWHAVHKMLHHSLESVAVALIDDVLLGGSIQKEGCAIHTIPFADVKKMTSEVQLRQDGLLPRIFLSAPDTTQVKTGQQPPGPLSVGR